MKLRLGLIGLGKHWENRHRPALRALNDRFEVRAICDQVGHRAQQAAREFGAVTVNGFRALCGRSDIDAVMLLGSLWYGTLPILAAADAGKSMYCSIPLDVELEEIHRIKERVNASGVAFVTEQGRRYSPATIRQSWQDCRP